MTDILFSIGGIVGIALIVLIIVSAIPRLVCFSVDTEGNPNHIYTIFMEESGVRGCRVTSAAGCLFPFIGLARPSIDIEGVVLLGFACVMSLILHLPVYKGYPVLNRNMKLVLTALFFSLFIASMLTRSGVIPSGGLVPFIMLSGILWGGFAVYRRSVLIRAEKRSSEQLLKPDG